MNELKHTPGPWKIIDKNYHASIINPGIDAAGGKISVVLVSVSPNELSGISGKDDQEREANAKLISAAPDLLEALHELLLFVQQSGLKIPIAVSTAPIGKARAAIKKATE